MKKEAMNEKTSKLAASKSPATSTRQPSVYSRLESLLRTMRCITGYEDALCELSHDVKRLGLLTPEGSEELRRILDKIPSHDYLHDLDAVSELLAAPAAPKKSPSKSTPKATPPKSKPKDKNKSRK